MQDSPIEQAYDTIIIGCGMAGLAAGIRLALYDQRVLILEKHNAPGGLNSFYFKEGRKFDVGLHAVTNFPQPGNRGTPMGKLFRQLRISADSFELAPQTGSRIAFPGVNLVFCNAIDQLEQSVAEAFPKAVDSFRELRQAVLAYDGLDLTAPPESARALIDAYIQDPLLREMILCPLMYYGSAQEQDMERGQFVTLWKAVFEEGFGRPLEGVRVIIRALLDKYRSLGGKRRMRCPVRRILLDGNRACGVELDSGEQIHARKILSTAGLVETELLCGRSASEPDLQKKIGRLSYAESISVFPEQPVELGCGETIIFFNDSSKLHYEQSVEPVDLRSGVICFPNNYRYPEESQLEEGIMRITMIANHHSWTHYPEEEYRAQKAYWFDRMVESGLKYLPDMDCENITGRTVYRDMFTPRTIEKYTSHLGGAVYGTPSKRKNGLTDYENLFLAGTDQGFLGIVGAMLSGISMANRHVLVSSK